MMKIGQMASRKHVFYGLVIILVSFYLFLFTFFVSHYHLVEYKPPVVQRKHLEHGKYFLCDIHYLNFFMFSRAERDSDLILDKSPPKELYNYVRKYFDWRRLCGPESTALHNPDLRVCYHHAFMSNETVDYLKEYYSHLPNIEFLPLDIDYEVNRSPFDFLKNGKWRHHAFSNVRREITEFSDVMRVALLWNYGGAYSDSDEADVRDVSKFFDMDEDVLFTFCGHKRCKTHVTNTPMIFKGKDSPYLKAYVDEIIERQEAGTDNRQWARYGAKAMEAVLEQDPRPGNLHIEPKNSAFLWTGDMREFWRKPAECPKLGKFETEAYYIHFLSKYIYQEAFPRLREGCCLDYILKRICPKSREEFIRMISGMEGLPFPEDEKEEKK